MSRDAAAQTSSTIPTPTPATFLALRDNQNPSTALLRSAPFGGNSHPVEVGALVMLFGLSEYFYEQIKRKKRFRDYDAFTHGGGVFKIDFLQWINVLSFLLANNGLLCMPPIIAGTHFSTVTNALNFISHNHAFSCASLVILRNHLPSSYEQLTALTTHLQNTVAVSHVALNTRFFSKNYQAGFEFANLLDAALNADLEIVEKMLSEACPKNRQTFLSTPGSAVITHLGIERTGTPLQMALYSHDEKMVEVIKQYIDPAEFQRQCEAVFGSDYNVFLARQQAEATQLCGELENAFRQASTTDVTNALNHDANTTSALQDVLNRFEGNLKRYVRENCVHNPYISQCLLETYEGFPFDWDKGCLFSKQLFGLAEKLSSAIWLSHISDGIFHLGYGDGGSSTVPSRGFLSHNSYHRIVDVRTLDRLGVDCYIDIFGSLGGGVTWRASDGRFLQRLYRTKTASFQNLLHRECNRLSA